MRIFEDSKEKIVYIAPHCSSSSYFLKKSQEINHFKEFTHNSPDEEPLLKTHDISDHTVIMIVRDPYTRFLSWHNRFNFRKWDDNESYVPVEHILKIFIRTANKDSHTRMLKFLYHDACNLYDLHRAKEHKFLNIKDLWIWFDERPHVSSFLIHDEHTFTLANHLETLREYFETDYDWLENLDYIYNFTNTKIKRPKYYKYEHAHEFFTKRKPGPVAYKLC